MLAAMRSHRDAFLAQVLSPALQQRIGASPQEGGAQAVERSMRLVATLWAVTCGLASLDAYTAFCCRCALLATAYLPASMMHLTLRSSQAALKFCLCCLLLQPTSADAAGRDSFVSISTIADILPHMHGMRSLPRASKPLQPRGHALLWQSSQLSVGKMACNPSP